MLPRRPRTMAAVGGRGLDGVGMSGWGRRFGSGGHKRQPRAAPDGAPSSRGRRRDGCAVVEAEAAEARKLDGGMAQVEAGDQTQEVEFDALDPAELDADDAEQGRFDASAAVGQTDIRSGT